MAYFSNETEEMRFENKNCDFCANQPRSENGNICAVWEVHTLFEHIHDDPEADLILEQLIPTDRKGFPGKCRMFRPKDKENDQ